MGVIITKSGRLAGWVLGLGGYIYQINACCSSIYAYMRYSTSLYFTHISGEKVYMYMYVYEFMSPHYLICKYLNLLLFMNGLLMCVNKCGGAV